MRLLKYSLKNKLVIEALSKLLFTKKNYVVAEGTIFFLNVILNSDGIYNYGTLTFSTEMV